MRVLLFVAVIAALAVAEANTQAQPNDGYFHFFNFIKKYGKVYTMDEFQTRFQVFQNNMVIAASLNERDTATYGNSPFMDLTPEEFRATYLMNKMPKTEAPGDLCVPKAGTVPATKNWVTEGKTTPVKDQGQCGSCWAFSVTENVESVWMIGGNKQIALAPQQIVDCDTKNFGCQGGWPYYAFEYIMGAGGMESEASYPYTAETEPCTFNKTKVAAEISSYCYLTKTKDEEQMRKFIGTTAPPSVCVDASSWQFYSGGVLSQCTQNIDHCVQAVGYGHDESSGLDYWLLRNSWGQGWGESGFLRITRNADTCAVAELATSAIL